jgi:membrane-associated protease RseP (regulator of RpoE activity)
LKNTPVFLLKSAARVISIPSLTGKHAKNGLYVSLVKPGLGDLLGIVAFLSMMFGLFNMFPLPILVGGSAFILAIELIRRRPFSEQSKERAQAVGFFVICGFMVLIIMHDLLPNFGTQIPILRSYLTVESVAPIIRWSEFDVRWSV